MTQGFYYASILVKYFHYLKEESWAVNCWPMQARTRNLSTGEFVPKCVQRHHAIYFSSSQKISTHPKYEYDSTHGQKYSAHFGSFSPVSVKVQGVGGFLENLSLAISEWCKRGPPQFRIPLSSTHKRDHCFSAPKIPQFNTPLSSTPKTSQFNTPFSYFLSAIFCLFFWVCWTEGFLVWNWGMCRTERFGSLDRFLNPVVSDIWQFFRQITTLHSLWTFLGRSFGKRLYIFQHFLLINQTKFYILKYFFQGERIKEKADHALIIGVFHSGYQRHFKY